MYRICVVTVHDSNIPESECFPPFSSLVTKNCHILIMDIEDMFGIIEAYFKIYDYMSSTHSNDESENIGLVEEIERRSLDFQSRKWDFASMEQ